MSKTSISDVVSYFVESRAGDARELELKFYLDDFDVFRRLYLYIQPNSTGSIDQSLNTVNDVDGRFVTGKATSQATDRRQITFKDGVKTGEQNIRKTKQQISSGSIGGGLRYQLAFALEQQIPTFNSATAEQIRLKLRSSLIHSEYPDWRFDFTIVKIIRRNQFAQIKTLTSEFFKKNITTSNFLEHAPDVASPILKPELEVEYVGAADVETIKQQLDSIMKLVENISRSSTPGQAVLIEIAQLLFDDGASARVGRGTLKQLANQPITLNLSSYKHEIVSNIDDFWLTDKADGDRCFVYTHPRGSYLLLTNDLVVLGNKYEDTVVLDAERVDGILYVFDALWVNGSMVNSRYEERLEAARAVIPRLDGIKLVMKPQVRLGANYSEQIQQMLDAKRPYEIDGLIFTPDTGYGTNTLPHPKYKTLCHYFDMVVYKYKPPDRNTIDFLVRAASGETGKLKKMYLFCGMRAEKVQSLKPPLPDEYDTLFPGVRYDKFLPVLFAPFDDPNAYIFMADKHTADVDGHVGEFLWIKPEDRASPDQKWKLVKIRYDRDDQVSRGIGYGNSYATAISIYEGLHDPFTIDQLLHPDKYTAPPPRNQYFAQPKQEQYKAVTRFNSFVKATIIRELFADAHTVIDLAAGKGQDLFALHGAGVHHVIFVDQDKSALAEIPKRAKQLSNPKHYLLGTDHIAKKFTHEQKVADLAQPSPSLIKILSIPKHSANGICMNFAIHYVVQSSETLTQLINLVDYLLAPGGVFMFTCFDGIRIYEALSSTKPNQSLEWGDGKYSIKKLYATEQLAFGASIGVLLPFSRGVHYTEFIVNVRSILTEFKKRKYVVLKNESFEKYFDKYSQSDRAIQMDADDKQFARLYSIGAVRK